MTAVHRQRIGTLDVTTVVVGRWSTNCHIIRFGERVAIVDPGAEPEPIMAAVGEGRVEQIVLTHGHYDHLGAAGTLCVRYGAPCRVHRADLELVRQAPLYAFGFDRSTVTVPAELVPFDDTPLMLGAVAIEIVPCAGHTAGSIALRLPGLILSGDTILREAIGRTDLPGGDREAIAASVERLLASEDPRALLLAGHGRPWEVGAASEWWRSQLAAGRPS